MDLSATWQAATTYAIVGALLAAVTMRRRRELRRGTSVMIVLMLVGLVGLWLLQVFGGNVDESRMALTLREVLLLPLAFGFAGILMTFLFQVLLVRLAAPRIMADLLFVVALIVYVLYRLGVVGVNLTSIVTTSAVITGVLAFSLQETLGNLWGGIALQLDNTCRIGDWIRVEGVTGEIVSIRWRYLAVATNSGETVIIPNSSLVKNRLTVIGRRGDDRVPWRRNVDFSVSYDNAPSRVIAVVADALGRAEIPFATRGPKPLVTCTSFDDNAIHYSAFYWLEDLHYDFYTDSQIRLHVHAALMRSHMEIPLPHRVLITPNSADRLRERKIDSRRAAREELLAQFDMFAMLTPPERRALATELVDCPFVRGDVISRQGDVSDSLFILASGTVDLYFGDGTGTGGRQKLATLVAPAYFGEMGLLTGQPRTATIVAQCDLLCYRLEKAGFEAILRARPELVVSFSEVVAKRQAANDATLQAADADARARSAVGRTAEIVARIRKFFDIKV